MRLPEDDLLNERLQFLKLSIRSPRTEHHVPIVAWYRRMATELLVDERAEGTSGCRPTNRHGEPF